MACLYPRSVGFLADGKTITYSPRKFNKEFATFQLPCGKCLQCRLDYANEWALRSVKEAMMYDENSFLTLTYDDEHLGVNKLDYTDFQEFIKKLRDRILADKIHGWTSMNNAERSAYRKEFREELEKIRISVFCTGEYGTKGKRKHWHALVFNYRPSDLVAHKTNHNGDTVYTSDTLNALWGKGFVTVGNITLESAGYCAKYATKSLEHGHDGCHEFTPLSRKSNKNAIGKKWLEAYWKNVFDLGYVDHDGKHLPIPRYFKKWLQKNHPSEWEKFVTKLNVERVKKFADLAAKEAAHQKEVNAKRTGLKGPQTSPLEHKRIIAKQKFNNSKEYERI